MLVLKALYPYLQEGGIVLRLRSLQSRTISTVTPTSLMYSLICCFHVFLGRTRRLSPGSAKFIVLRVTLFSSRCCTCLNHRRPTLSMISSIGAVLFPHSGCAPAFIPLGSQEHHYLCGGNFLLVVSFHCQTFTAIC